MLVSVVSASAPLQKWAGRKSIRSGEPSHGQNLCLRGKALLAISGSPAGELDRWLQGAESAGSAMPGRRVRRRARWEPITDPHTRDYKRQAAMAGRCLVDHCVRLVGWQRGRLARDVVDDEVVDVEAHRPYFSKHCSVLIQTDSVVMWTLLPRINLMLERARRHR